MEAGNIFMILVCAWIIPGSCLADKDPCKSPSSSFIIPGDATIIGLFDIHKGPNCSTVVTTGIHQMLSAVWVVKELNRYNLIPGVTLGLWLYDACSDPPLARKALLRGLEERVCHGTYPLGVVTTPSILSHVQEMVTTSQIPVFTTSSEHKYQHHVPAASLTATLLSALNRTKVAVVLASSTQIISTFGQAASTEGICIRHQTAIPDPNNSNWTTVLRTSEPRETGQVAVVFGSTDQILETMQSVHRDNATAVLQWVFVPLDMSRDLGFLGNLPADSLIVAPRASIMREIEETMMSMKKMARSNNNENYNITPVITSSPLFLEIASPIVNISRKLRSAQTRYCKPAMKNSNTGLCHNLPPFHHFSSQTLSDSNQLPASNIETLLLSTVSDGISFYAVERVKTDPKYDLEEIGTFQIFYNNTVLLKLVSDHINVTLNFERNGKKQCTLDYSDSSCRNVCVMGQEAQDSNEENKKSVPSIKDRILSLPIVWRQDAWVAAVASISSVGIACSLAVSVFILVRICKGDMLEGNPSFSFLLLIAIDCTYCSILPFSFISDEPYHRGVICGLRIFGTSVSYALLFSIMLSRSFMLASCDQDGGFMSHVNGYLQTILCFFIAGVQVALSVQFWAINSALLGSRQCASIYEGHLFLLLLSYDVFLLLLLVCTSPFIARSKRNYQEGIFFTAASVLCLIIFIGWNTTYVLVPRIWQDAAITGGLTATATAILVTVFIPRTYLMMTAIVRDHLASVLPSLAYTSSTSIQDINYRSTQALYDTVTPHPLVHPPEVTGQVNSNFYSEQPQSPLDSGPSTSTTKPSNQRGFGERRTISPENTYERYDTPPSPQKVTRF